MNLRIAMICPYALDVPGGVQNQVVGLTRALQSLGHEMAVIAPGSFEGSENETFAFYDVGAIHSIPVNGSRAPICFGPFVAHRTKAALRAFGPSIVHIHEPFVPGPALTATRLHRSRTIATFHRSGVGRGYRALGPALRPLMKKMDDVLSVSNEAYATMRDVVGDRAPAPSIIANGVEVARFSEVEPWPADGVVVAFAGRHERRKGLGVLLEAFCRSAVDATLWVIGSGPQSEALRARYASDKRIVWCGRVNDEELARRLRRADIFVAPSLGGESFGVVLLEAMAAKSAIIASDLPGYRLAAKEAASYVPPSEVEPLERALEELCREPALRSTLVGRGAARAHEQDFSLIANQYLPHYQRLAAC